MTGVFSSQEVHLLFDQYLLGTQEVSLQQVTLRIMELSILKDPEQRNHVLRKLISVLTSQYGVAAYYPIQSFYRRIETLLIYFIRDLDANHMNSLQDAQERQQLSLVFKALIDLFKESFQHYQSHPDNELYQYLKSHLDDQNILQFSVLQMEPCLPCLLQSKKPPAQEFIKIMSAQIPNKDLVGFDLKIYDNQYWISMKKFYNIDTIKIDLKDSTESFLKEIKVYRSNTIQSSAKIHAALGLSNMELIEPASVTQQAGNIVLTFSPPVRAETIIFQFSILEQVGNCGCGFRGRESRENPFWMQAEKSKASALYCQRCGEHFLLKQIQVSNQMTLNVMDLPIQDETQLANLQKMMYDLNKQAQCALKSLQKHKQQLTINFQKTKSNHQRRSKVKLTESIITEMTNLYDEYNSYSVAVQSMAKRYSMYYNDENFIEDEQVNLFSDCVSCSQRFLTHLCGLTQNFQTSNRQTIHITNELKEFYSILDQAIISPITLSEKYMFAQQLSSQMNQLVIQNKGKQLQILQEEQNKYLMKLTDTYEKKDPTDQKYFVDFSAKILVWSASSSLSSTWQKSYSHDQQIVEQLVNHRKSFQRFLADGIRLSQQVSCFNIYCLNGPLYNLLLVTDKLVKQLGGVKSTEGKRKKLEASQVDPLYKEDLDVNKKQLQSQCIKFFGDVLNLKEKQSMDLEYSVDTKISYKVEDNMISRLLLLTDNYELVDSMKSILVVSASLDFQLTVGAMLNNFSVIQSSAQYFEMFLLLKSFHGKRIQGLAEYLSLVEQLLDIAIELLKQPVLNATPILSLVQLVKRFLELSQPDFPQYSKELENRQLTILFQLLRLQMLASSHPFETNIIEILQLMPELYKICAPQQSQKLYELLLNELFSQSNKPQDVQKIADMLHQRIFTNLDYKIRAQANRQAEEYIHRRHLEISSKDLPRELGGGIIVETLKRKIKDDLQLEMDFDIVVCSKLIDDTSRSLDTIYSRFYLNEVVRADFLQTKGQTFRNDENSQNKIISRVKEILQGVTLPTMNVEFCIRGIGNHDQLPYLPLIQDEDLMQQQDQLTKSFLQKGAIVLFFRVLQKLVVQQMFNLTVKKLVELIRFVTKSQEIKREVFGCQGLVILLRVFLMDAHDNQPNNSFQLGLIQTMTELLVAAQDDDSLARGPTNKRRLSEHMDQRDVSYFEKESSTNLKMVLKNLDTFQDNPSVVRVFLQIVPLIIRDLHDPCFQLFDYFQGSLDFSQPSNLKKIDYFTQIVYYTPVHYCVLRNLIVDQGVFQNAFEYLKQVQESLEVESFMENALDLTQSALRIISSVAKGKPRIQTLLLEDGALNFILKLSTSSEEKLKHCSKICQDFVQFLKNDQNEVDQNVMLLVKGSFEANELAKKQQAQSKRSEMMKRFQKNNQPYQEKLKLMEDEKGLYCQTCKEGYTLNPDNLLGVYLYTIPDKILDESQISNDNQIPQAHGVHSVTYFTVMHLSCHKKTVDYALKISRKEQEESGVRRSGEEVEWECAQKNNVAKCNNFFPIKPARNAHIVDEGLRFYMQRSEHISRSKLQSLFWIILNDLRSLLIKFAKEEDLARDTGAGRYEHNIKLIPFYVSTLIYLIDINVDYGKTLVNISKVFTQCNHESSIQNQSILELLLCSSIITSPPSEWNQRKIQYMQMIRKLCGANQNIEVMLQKENKYFLNLVSLISLIYKSIESCKFSKKLTDVDYFKTLNTYISEDNIRIIKLFEAIEKEYTQLVLKATCMNDYQKYLN